MTKEIECPQRYIFMELSVPNDLFKTYSMKTDVLLHFEHKNDVTIIVKFCKELRAVSEQLCEVWIDLDLENS